MTEQSVGVVVGQCRPRTGDLNMGSKVDLGEI